MSLLKKFRSGPILIISGALLMLTFIACYSDYGMSVEDYDVVTTLYNPAYDFKIIKTYSMPDSIFHITPDDQDDSNLSREYDKFILDRIAQNMELRGIRRITDPTQELPNGILLVRAVSTENYQAYSNYYWGGYWGWGGGWGGYYPWYGGTTVYSYTTGSLLIDLMDVASGDIQEKEFPTEWIAGINGLLGDTGTSIQRRLTTNIDQAFIQSPYIGTPE